jgi:hypothetical protein
MLQHTESNYKSKQAADHRQLRPSIFYASTYQYDNLKKTRLIQAAMGKNPREKFHKSHLSTHGHPLCSCAKAIQRR